MTILKCDLKRAFKKFVLVCTYNAKKTERNVIIYFFENYNSPQPPRNKHSAVQIFVYTGTCKIFVILITLFRKSFKKLEVHQTMPKKGFVPKVFFQLICFDLKNCHFYRPM